MSATRGVRSGCSHRDPRYLHGANAPPLIRSRQPASPDACKRGHDMLAKQYWSYRHFRTAQMLSHLSFEEHITLSCASQHKEPSLRRGAVVQVLLTHGCL